MSEVRETVTLVRQVLQYGPDGQSVGRFESVDVEIIWPDGRPGREGTHREYGGWSVVEEARDA